VTAPATALTVLPPGKLTLKITRMTHRLPEGNKYLSEENLQKAAKKRRWILSEPGEEPEVVIVWERPKRAGVREGEVRNG
jgi:hypothetical protein